MMGAAENQISDAQTDRELPVHQVTISKDFYIADVPVTNDFMNNIFSGEDGRMKIAGLQMAGDYPLCCASLIY